MSNRLFQFHKSTLQTSVKLWKNEKFTRIEKIFRQINYLVHNFFSTCFHEISVKKV